MKKYIELQNELTDVLNYARDLYDLREFKRTAFVLKPYLTTGNQSVIFLHYYSLFMYGDIRKEEEQYENSNFNNLNLLIF
jgi:anaphase-promoting complex subunit 8